MLKAIVTTFTHECCLVCYYSPQGLTVFTEMARHNQGGEISAENTTPKQHRVQRMLPARAHCLGKIVHECQCIIY